MSAPEATKERTWKRAALLLPAQMFARGLEALLPIALAAWFGRSGATDAYWASYALFLFALSLVASAFQDSALVPVLTELLAEDPDEHRTTTRSLVGSAGIMGTLVGVAFVALATAYFAFLAPTDETRPSGLLLWPFAALAPVIALRSLFAGMLQARGTLQVAPLSAGLGAAVQLAVLFALKSRLGIAVVPFAQLASEAVQATSMGIVLRGDDRYDLRPLFERTAAAKRIFRLILSQVLGTAVTRANPIVDQSFAFRAHVTGAVTALRYSVDVATAPTMLLEATLFQVVFVDLSRAAAARDWNRFRAITRRGILQVSGVIALTSALLAVLRRPIIELVFAHGAMDAGGVELLVSLLPWALIDAIPFAVLLILVRANVALQNTHIMLPLGIINVALNAALNAALLRPFGLGGLLAATAGTQAIVAIILYLALQRSLRSKIQSGVFVDR
ncbi:MAG: lipid II flippase MurJ [Polyangiaceae bacterium]